MRPRFRRKAGAVLIEYPKTSNLFARDPETHALTHMYKMPEFQVVAEHAWRFTEKIDGMNVRLILTRDSAELRGRSDRAQLPSNLACPALLPSQEIDDLYAGLNLPDDVVVTLYGEAYGAGIQKGGGYGAEKRIAFFDLMTSRRVPKDAPRTGEWSHAWRRYGELQFALMTFALEEVPTLPTPPIESLIATVRAGFQTHVHNALPDTMAEGVVARTDPYLFNARRERVMFKLKTKDLQ